MNVRNSGGIFSLLVGDMGSRFNEIMDMTAEKKRHDNATLSANIWLVKCVTNEPQRKTRTRLRNKLKRTKSTK